MRTTADIMYKLEQAIENETITLELLEETRRALLNVHSLDLSPEKRKENEDALARVTTLETMVYGKVPTHPQGE